MKLTIADLNTGHNPTWCPGCGDFGIWGSIKNALVELNLDPDKTVIVYGIGCSGNMCNTINTYGFHGLHGRALPVAEGIKLANSDLTVICVVGDGDQYGEGINHLIHAARANHDITCIVHNNEVYGLTTGQVSPTAELGHIGKSTPNGTVDKPINPLSISISAGVTFAARSFSGNPSHLKDTLVAALKHKGFSHVDVLQNCPSFNKYNTFDYLQDRTYILSKNDTSKKIEALRICEEPLDKIPIGIIYEENRKTFHEQTIPALYKNPVQTKLHVKRVGKYLERYQ